jgi:hypothetical protein
LRQVTNPCRLQPAYQTSGSFPPPVSDIEAATPAHDGPPQMTRIASPACRTPIPADQDGCPLWMASPLTRPSPSLRRIGIRNFTFETGPGFPHVTARWMTQLPKAALSRGSDPTGCPAEPLVSGQVNRHPFWVDPSSTDDTPRLGTRGVPGSVVSSDAAQPRVAGSGAGWSSAESMKRKREL